MGRAGGSPADGGKAGEPVKLLLSDEQDDLQPGKITRNFEGMFKVQAPHGASCRCGATLLEPRHAEHDGTQDVACT